MSRSTRLCSASHRQTSERVHRRKIFKTASRLRSSRRIRRARIAAAKAWVAATVELSTEESTRTEEQVKFRAAFNASAHGSAPADGTLARPSVSRTTTDSGVTNCSASSSACARGVRPPVGRNSRRRRAASMSRQGSRTISAFAPRNEMTATSSLWSTEDSSSAATAPLTARMRCCAA